MRRPPAQPPAPPQPAAEPEAAPDLIELPEFDKPEVSLIIPVHSHAALTRACLVSIRDRTAGGDYEIIIVADTPDAETVQLLESVRGAKIIQNETNLGFLRSMNRGASFAEGKWLVLFNNDTEVTRGWLSAMLECATSAEDVGVVTPKFVYPDGSLNEAGGIVWRDGSAMNYGRGDAPDRFQYEYRRETDYGSAAALMVSAELWRQVGGFDERYRPIYYEDTDLCFQARQRGLRVLYEPGAVVVHVEGATSGTDPSSGAKRNQELNRQKFVSKWRGQLEVDHQYPAPTNVRSAANRARGERVLVIDHRVPMSDRDSGSLRMLSIMQALIRLGARVTFMPDNLASVQPYTRRLQSSGIEVIYGPVDVRAELATIGPTLSTAILCRPHTTSRWLDTVREFAPAARIVYDTVDLHWLREARKGAKASVANGLITNENSPDLAALCPKARALRELELALIRASDATLVLSESERVQVEEDVPGANVLVLPNVHDPVSYVPPPENRSGILFVGGFEHPPNVDAAIHLVKDVMPAVWSELGEVRVCIVGSLPPPEVEALASPLVDVVGWVEDLQPLLERSRLMAAPLSYGAGLKGKITQCLSVGLPVVTTSIGAEGLVDNDRNSGAAESDEDHLLVSDDAHEMAARIVRLYTDDELWLRLSRNGQQVIAGRCSTAVVTRRLAELLGDEGPRGDDDATRSAPALGEQPSAGEGAHNEPAHQRA
jgi:O-antigen biosynthesis protein